MIDVFTVFWLCIWSKSIIEFPVEFSFFCFHVFLTFLMSFSFIAIFRVLTYESKTYTGLQLRNVVERFLRFFLCERSFPELRWFYMSFGDAK